MTPLEQLPKMDEILHEAQGLSADALEEVLSFVQFLRWKSISAIAPITLASEAVLSEDWLSPEDEEAWKDL